MATVTTAAPGGILDGPDGILHWAEQSQLFSADARVIGEAPVRVADERTRVIRIVGRLAELDRLMEAEALRVTRDQAHVVLIFVHAPGDESARAQVQTLLDALEIQ